MKFVHKKFLTKNKFSGWGMETVHELPWNDEYDWGEFKKASIDVKKLYFTKEGAHIDRDNVDELLWRHWILCYSVRYAIRFAKTTDYNFVECGVADGCSAFFTLREINSHITIREKCTVHLYDSWNAMRSDGLSKSEIYHVGKYANLSIDVTKKNLSEFNEKIIYHQGFIPESLHSDPSSPEFIVYLHIDLNSAKPTIDVLNFFLPRLVAGGVIVFDDYAWEGYEDTKKVIDAYFRDKPGLIMKLPTGQAIYYHH